MGLFHYDTPVNPYVASVGDLLLRKGDIAARAAEQIGAANARAAEVGGQAWANGVRNIGDTVAAVPGQIEQQQRQRVIDEGNALKVAAAQRQVQGQKAVAGMMQGDQLPAGDAGPRQQGFLSADGLFDVQKITSALSKSGYGDIAPELTQGAERINESITKHQETEAQLAKEHAILIGDIAHAAISLKKTGLSTFDAMDTAVQPALATKRITPEDYAQVRQQLGALPQEQQDAALNAIRDQAAKLAPTKVLAEGAQETDRYGQVIASGAKKPPTPAELAFDLSSDDPAVRARAKTAIDALHPPQRRTDVEQELDAYAKSIGKPDASALTYGERQIYEQNKSKIHADASYQQHVRERAFDNANPAPDKVKSQDSLEQEYRTVLARGLSSRSGGLGGEDAKVQQANHLLSLFEQTYNPKTGGYDIPRVQLNELALGLAKLTAGTGPAGEGMLREFQQRTVKGDLAGALTYLTGQPIAANTQAITTFLKDSIERQGKTAEQNREGEMAYLRNLAPTNLNEDRRKQLESTSLNPLRQSRVIENTQTHERKVQVSVDGGATWK